MRDLTEGQSFAAAAADAAREIALSYFRRPLDVVSKSDDSPVTVADRDIERLLRDTIAKTFPDHGIFGEEESPVDTDHRYVWVVDPIDGTKSFVTGHPLFGGLVALLEDGTPCLGQIDMPALDERYVGMRGAQTTVNGAICRTSGRTRPAEAYAYTTDPDLFVGTQRAALDVLRRETRMLRFGGDCYAFALLASGHCDVVLETGLEPYDYLPVVPVVEGAGGTITDWSGAKLTLDSRGDVLAAATPDLHGAMLDHLRHLTNRAANGAD